MKQATNTVITNFLISRISLSKDVDELINRLSYWARQAYFARDQEQVSRITEILELTNYHGQAIGQFYKASVLNNGPKDLDQASKIWQKLIDDSPPPVRAASLLALGLNELQEQNFTEANRHIGEASDYGLSRGKSPIVYLHAQSSLSYIRSIEGDHVESLKILQKITPEIKYIGKYFPAIAAEHWNNCAYELACVRELEIASHLINKAVSSPYAKVNPSWFDTKKEIDERLGQKRNASFVAGPTSRFNVVRFPSKSANISLKLIDKGYHFNVLKMDINDTEESQDSKVSLFTRLDNLTYPLPTKTVLRGHISSDDPDEFIFERFIERASINEVMRIVQDFRDIQLPPNDDKPEKREDEATALSIFAKIKAKLE